MDKERPRRGAALNSIVVVRVTVTALNLRRHAPKTIRIVCMRGASLFRVGQILGRLA